VPVMMPPTVMPWNPIPVVMMVMPVVAIVSLSSRWICQRQQQDNGTKENFDEFFHTVFKTDFVGKPAMILTTLFMPLSPCVLPGFFAMGSSPAWETGILLGRVEITHAETVTLFGFAFGSKNQ
jgi:hypothetical protein